MAKLALDIGGTYLRYEIFNGISKSGSIKTEDIDIFIFIDSLLKKYKNIEAIGISFAGFINDNTIINSPNIANIDNNLAKKITKNYNIPVYIENDLNCASLAESKYFDTDNLVAIYSGTGIGCGIINNGILIKGNNSFAGEIGHIPYKNAQFKCGCGRFNCLENWASGRAIIKQSQIYNCENLTLKELFYSPKKECQSIAREYIQALIYSCGVAITLFNPSILVLGGGVIASNSWILEIIKDKISDYTLAVSLENCEIKISKLNNASLEGAKYLIS